jgi:hypothetical protein
LPCVSRQGAVNVGMLGSSVHIQEAYSNQEPLPVTPPLGERLGLDFAASDL